MDVQPKVLEYLQTYGACLDVLCKLLSCALAKAGTNIAEVDIGEEHHAIGVRAAFDYGESTSQIVSPTAAQIHDEPNVELVHRLHHLFILLRRDRCWLMAVDVNHWELRSKYRMLWHDQCRTRLILADIRWRPLRLASFGRTGTDLAGRLRLGMD